MTEETIFTVALEKLTPAEQVAYLDEACAGDIGLRRRVEALLASHGGAGSFLGTPAVQFAAAEMGGPVCVEPTQEELPGGADSDFLVFLSPSQKPDSLGRFGHYEILEVIGRGGMGVVLKALDEKLQRVVALKVMGLHLAVNGTGRQRFVREGRAAAAVRDDHVVGIHVVEEAGDLPYLVMEYIAGASLQERLDRDETLGLKEVLRIGMQIARGLAAAHAQGLIHRDIKPSNILLENGVERVKITDFGLARAVDDASLTQSGVIAGTPQYMAPEQARGEAVDHRADLFSLGSVLYAMCAGHPPFRATGTMAVLKRVCEEAPRPIRETNPDIPDWLVAIIDKLHAKNPADRYQSAAEVADLLNQCLAHLQQRARVPLPLFRPDKSPRSGWRCRRIVATGVLLCLAVIGMTETTGFTRLTAALTGLFVPEATPPKKTPSAGRTSASEFKVGLVRQHLWSGRHTYFTCFSPDSRFYAATGSAGGLNTLRVWEVATGTLVMEVEGNESCLFTPDGKHLLAAGPDKQIHLWEVPSGKEIHQYGQHPDWITTMELSSSGKQLLSGCSDGIMRLCDYGTLPRATKLPNWMGMVGRVMAPSHPTASESSAPAWTARYVCGMWPRPGKSARGRMSATSGGLASPRMGGNS